MGEVIGVLQEIASQRSCLHDLYYYVLNDSECHSTCTEYITCDCETRRIEHTSDTIEDDEIEVSNCCFMRHQMNTELNAEDNAAERRKCYVSTE